MLQLTELYFDWMQKDFTELLDKALDITDAELALVITPVKKCRLSLKL